MNENPTTIKELMEWYKEQDLPSPEVTRFFIGMNYQYPKAFGIYKDDFNYIVYKNKADGTRTIRYEGPDEAYAVNEIFMKLLDEASKRNLNLNHTNEVH